MLKDDLLFAFAFPDGTERVTLRVEIEPMPRSRSWVPLTKSWSRLCKQRRPHAG